MHLLYCFHKPFFFAINHIAVCYHWLADLAPSYHWLSAFWIEWKGWNGSSNSRTSHLLAFFFFFLLGGVNKDRAWQQTYKKLCAPRLNNCALPGKITAGFLSKWYSVEMKEDFKASKRTC